MSDAPTPRRLTPKGQATRARIVEAATALIADRGVAGVGVEDVRAAAAVSGSQLYHYFASKQELIRAVITSQADALLRQDGLRITALDSFDALRAWADAAIENQQADDGRARCDLGSLAAELTATDDETRTDLADGFMRWKDMILNGLRAMRERGELRPEADLEELAFALLAALQGGQLLAQTVRDVQPMRAALNTTLSYIRSFGTDRTAQRTG